MRLLSSICAMLCCIGILNLHAEEPPLPKPETQDPIPPPSTGNPLAIPAIDLAPSAPQLMSPDVLSLEERSAASPAPLPNTSAIPPLDQSLAQNATNAAAENSRRQVEWRKLRNIMANDAEVKKAMARAESARTDLEKRRLLREYYNFYFGKMTAIASPDMKPYLQARKNEQLNTLPQPHVRPSSAVPAKARQ